MACFTKTKCDEIPLMRQRLQLPFAIAEDLEVSPEIIRGHDFLKVIGKRFVKKIAKSTEFEERFTLSELEARNCKIVQKDLSSISRDF